MTQIFIIIPILFISLFLSATELYMSRDKALKLGFKPQPSKKAKNATTFVEAHALAWPVQFVDSRHTIGNNMPEYQNYGSEAYYHEGADLRLPRAGAVIAPIHGFLQGDYYTYVTDPETGEDKKYTKPITAGGDDLYFEITIRTSENYMLEFHHVDPKRLPKSIYDLVLRGGGNIQRGELVGYASVWPVSRYGERYDHIHYDLISPEGFYLNPEYFSEELPDTKPPVIKNIFAIYPGKKIEVLNQKLNGVPSELVISAIDFKGENIYPLPPVRVEIFWNNIQKTGWDFTQRLLTYSGKFPDIREVYARNLKLSDGRVFSTKGDYNRTEFLFRLKLPSHLTGPLLIEVQDVSGNLTRTVLELAQ